MENKLWLDLRKRGLFSQETIFLIFFDKTKLQPRYLNRVSLQPKNFYLWASGLIPSSIWELSGSNLYQNFQNFFLHAFAKSHGKFSPGSKGSFLQIRWCKLDYKFPLNFFLLFKNRYCCHKKALSIRALHTSPAQSCTTF